MIQYTVRYLRKFVNLPQLNYKQKIVASIFLYTLIPLLMLGSILALRMWNEKVQEVLNVYKKQLESSIDSTNSLFLTSLQKIDFISTDRNIHAILNMPFNQNLSSIVPVYENVAGIIRALEADNGRKSINVFHSGEDTYHGEYLPRTDLLQEGIKKELLEGHQDAPVWRLGSYDGSGQNSDTLFIYKSFVTLSQTKALIEFKIPLERIRQQYVFKLPANSFISYVSEADSVSTIHAENVTDSVVSSITEDYLKNGPSGSYYVIPSQLKFSPHQVVMFIPKSHVSRELRIYIYLIPVILSIFIVIIFLAINRTSIVLTRQLHRLIHDMNADIENIAVTDESFSPGREDEFSRLKGRFRDLAVQIKDYYHQLSKYELENRSLELKLLQERINPHFLYNTLSAIKIVYRNEELAQIIDSMVRYYRIALSKGNEIVKLSQEIHMLEAYIKLQKFAYDSDLTYEITLEEGVTDCKILKQLLQPIVENSILHGINGLNSGGKLRISGNLEDDQLVILIHDNGVGMTQEAIDRIFCGDSESMYSGYGIKNIQERIKLYYGRQYGIRIQSKPGEGTIVTLKIPVVDRTLD